MTALQIYLYSINEYKRFMSFFELNNNSELTDNYDESEYIAVSTKLMLLRKYMEKGEKIYIDNILNGIKRTYPNSSVNDFEKRFQEIQDSNLRTIRKNGTRNTMRETAENFMYGLHLHANPNRIECLREIDEDLMFVVVRHYVNTVEKLVLDIADYIEGKGISPHKAKKTKKAALILRENYNESGCEIKKSPFWSNLYGKDLQDGELSEIIKDMSLEDLSIYLLCACFFSELKKDDYSVKVLSDYVHPVVKRDFGNFSKAHEMYLKIESPGLSNAIDYNERHDIAYVKVFQNVEDAFLITGKYIVEGIMYVNLVKRDDGWKIYSLGGKMDDYLISSAEFFKGKLEKILKRIVVGRKQ